MSKHGVHTRCDEDVKLSKTRESATHVREAIVPSLVHESNASCRFGSLADSTAAFTAACTALHCIAWKPAVERHVRYLAAFQKP